MWGEGARDGGAPWGWVGAQRGRRALKLINEGGVRVGWLWVSATAKSELLQTTKFLLPYATKLPTSPSHATLRAHLGCFPSCSRWGPQKKGL